MLRAFIRSNAGLLLIVASEVFYAFMNLSVKILTTGESEVPLLEIIFLRMVNDKKSVHMNELTQNHAKIVTYVFSVTYLYCANISNPILGPPEVRLLILCRGFWGFIGLFGNYYALQYLSLSDCIVITSLSPLCTAIGGSFLLGEKFRKGDALAGIVSLVGVVLIARPPSIFGSIEKELHINGVTTEQRMAAVCVALMAALGFAGASLSTRAIGKRAHPLHNMAYLSLLSAIVSLGGFTITRTPVVIPKQTISLCMLSLIGIFGFIAQILMNMGYQIQAAGSASMGIYSQVIFGVILERLVFGAVPSILSMLGTGLILGSVLCVTMTKEKEGGDSSNDGKIALPGGEDVEEGRGLFEPYCDSDVEVEG